MGITGGFIMIAMAVASAIFVFVVIATLLEIYHPENRVRVSRVAVVPRPIYRATVSSARAQSGSAVLPRRSPSFASAVERA